MRKIYSLSLMALTVLACSCSKTIYLNYDITQPARINIPDTIKSFGVVNRSLPNAETKKSNQIEEILSLEGLKIDQKGSETLETEFCNELTQKNFICKTIKDPSTFKNNLSNVRPAPISWDTLRRFAKTQKIQGLIVLEYFDTDSRVNVSSTPTTITNPLGGAPIPSNRFNVNITTNIKAFWRVYDLVNEKIIDEYSTDRNVYSNGSGISLLAAYGAIKERETDVINSCADMVDDYTRDMFERFVRVSQPVYIKGSETLVKAGRMVRTINIEGAMTQWQSETSTKDKIKGRALYNQAVGLDFFQKPDEALKIAQKAYEEYHNKKAIRLVQQLNKRERTIVRY